MNAVPSAGGYVLAFKLALTTVFPVTTVSPYKNLFALAAAAKAGLLTAFHIYVCVHMHWSVIVGNLCSCEGS